MIPTHNMTYPQPLYQRAVNAYLRAFRDKHGLKETDITPVGVPEYPLYLIEPWTAAVNFDDIRLDVDGLDYNGRHIDAPEEALYNYCYDVAEMYTNSGQEINYRTYLLNL